MQPKVAMLPLSEAQERLLTVIRSRMQLTAATVSIFSALDRTLAADVFSPIAVPTATNSAMDGYALRFADVMLSTQQCWQIVGQSLAGHPFEGEIPAGACIRITTGAVVPADLDTVVMQEDTQWAGDDETALFIKRRPIAGQHIRLCGSELEIGQLVLQQGSVLGPLQLGLLATLGIAQVSVYQQVRVGVLSSGDELKQPGEVLQDGDLFDSNRLMLLSVLKRFGCEVVDLGWVRDDPQALRSMLQKAADSVDVIVSSGGVSVGDADYTRQVLSELGQMDFWQVAIKPGKPFAFGWLNRADSECHDKIPPVWLFGLPGNPVSAAVTCEQLLIPALQLLSGQQVKRPVLWPAKVVQGLRKKPGRLDMQRVCLQVTADGIKAESVGTDSSGMLSSMMFADALTWLEQQRSDVAPGEDIWVQPKSCWWR